ncbi:class I SAM-dependent methyltransferase [Chloroflexota bacterium]
MVKDIQCIFCNRDSDQIVIEENGYKGKKCPQCGLIFVSPRPAFAEILNLYTHKLPQANGQSYTLWSFTKRLCAKHSLRIIKKFVKNGSMLEIGAGMGYVLDEAKKEGFEVYGIELNNSEADFIRSEFAIPCEESPLDVSLFDGKKFDIIYHCNIISHIYDPISEFQKINDKLVKKGIVVFETGNLGDVKEKYYKFVTKFGYPGHLFFFSENNLKELLERTGFEFVKIYRYSRLPELVIFKMLMFEKVINFVKSKWINRNIAKPSISGVTSSNMSISNIGRFIFKQLINAYGYSTYFFRYKIGYVMPKTGRIQTVIVVARRKN